MATMGNNRTIILASLPTAFVATIAGIVSYGHIAALGQRTHQESASYLLPFAVDFLIVGGSVIVLAGYALGWLCIVAGVAATLFANLEFGLPYGWLAAVVSTWPAVAFTVATFVLERWLRSRRTTPPATRKATPVIPAGDMNGGSTPLLSPRMTNLDLARQEGVSVRTIQRRKAAANGHAPAVTQ